MEEGEKNAYRESFRELECRRVAWLGRRLRNSDDTKHEHEKPSNHGDAQNVVATIAKTELHLRPYFQEPSTGYGTFFQNFLPLPLLTNAESDQDKSGKYEVMSVEKPSKDSEKNIESETAKCKLKPKPTVNNETQTEIVETMAIGVQTELPSQASPLKSSSADSNLVPNNINQEVSNLEKVEIRRTKSALISIPVPENQKEKEKNTLESSSSATNTMFERLKFDILSESDHIYSQAEIEKLERQVQLNHFKFVNKGSIPAD